MPEPRRLLSTFPDRGSHWKPSGSGILFLLRPEGGILANCNRWGIEAVHCLYFGKPRIYQMWMYTIHAVQCSSHVSEINAELPRGTEPDILLNLFGQHDSLLKEEGGACAALVCCVQSFLGTEPEAKTHKVWILLMRLTNWLITSPKRGWGPAKRTWKLWQSSLCPKLTWKSEPFWAWWGTICNSSRNTLWYMWPQTKLQKLLLGFCGGDISQSSEHQPSFWVTEKPTSKATSSESFARFWAYGRLGLHLTMLEPMDRWNKVTKCWCTW